MMNGRSWKVTDPECRRTYHFRCSVCKTERTFQVHPLDVHTVRYWCDVCDSVEKHECLVGL